MVQAKAGEAFRFVRQPAFPSITVVQEPSAGHLNNAELTDLSRTTVSSTPAITAGETCHGVVLQGSGQTGLAPPRLEHSKLEMPSGLIRVPDFGQTMDVRSPEVSPSHVMVGVSRLEQVPHHGVHILQAIAHVAQKVFKPRRQRGQILRNSRGACAMLYITSTCLVIISMREIMVSLMVAVMVAVWAIADGSVVTLAPLCLNLSSVTTLLLLQPLSCSTTAVFCSPRWTIISFAMYCTHHCTNLLPVYTGIEVVVGVEW